MTFDLTKTETKLFDRLNTPQKIQDFLDAMPINFEKHGDTLYSPRKVLKLNRAHCIEAALFAAAILWHHGHKPLLMDLKTTSADMDHVVCLFKQNSHWGAIAKTNHAVLGWRDPIYKSPRELAMSFFHEYFLDNGKKTLRSYSKPFDLSKLGRDWVTADKHLFKLALALDKSPHFKILTKATQKTLRRVTKLQIKAGKHAYWKRK